uniref:Intraflagellar transport protein 56 n=1 Tax=Scophthalmus maximus TaxID=52904 RepID=A0A8D3DZT7_SCOMX
MILSRVKPAVGGESQVSCSEKKKNKTKVPPLEEYLQQRDYLGALTLLEFQRSIGEKEEHADLWIGYCAFHLGDYKRAMEVCFHVCLIECVQLGAHIHNVPKIQYLNSDCLSRM